MNEPVSVAQRPVEYCWSLSRLLGTAEIPRTASFLWRLPVNQCWKTAQWLAILMPAPWGDHGHVEVFWASCDQNNASCLPYVCLALNPQWKRYKVRTCWDTFHLKSVQVHTISAIYDSNFRKNLWMENTLSGWNLTSQWTNHAWQCGPAIPLTGRLCKLLRTVEDPSWNEWGSHPVLEMGQISALERLGLSKSCKSFHAFSF